MRNSCLIFDWDGTLVDIKNKYYKVYKDIITSLGGHPLSKKDLWDLKRADRPVSFILSHSKLPVNLEEEYKKEFIKRIEQEKYLLLDTLLPGADNVLEKLGRNCKLYLSTMRRNKDLLYNQLIRFQLKSLFDKVFLSSKEDIFSEFKDIRAGTVIGDSQNDILTAHKNGFISVAVLSGIRNRQLLRLYNPDFIIRDVSLLPRVLSRIHLSSAVL